MTTGCSGEARDALGGRVGSEGVGGGWPKTLFFILFAFLILCFSEHLSTSEEKKIKKKENKSINEDLQLIRIILELCF